MNVAEEAMLARAKAKGTYLASLYLMVHHKIELLKPMVFDRDFIDRFNKTRGADSFQRLRLTLLNDVIKDLVEITLEDDLKSASLASLIHDLKDGRTRKILREWNSRPTGARFFGDDGLDEAARQEEEARLNERQRQQRSERFDRDHAELNAAFEQISKHPLSGSFKGFRHQLVAHYSITPPNREPAPIQPQEFGVKWGDPEAYLQMIEGPVFKMVLITTGASWDVIGFKQSHVQGVRSFWGLPG